jgi:hypothetical protein
MVNDARKCCLGDDSHETDHEGTGGNSLAYDSSKVSASHDRPLCPLVTVHVP